MIKHLRLINHKALISPQIINVDHINVICGKNNSGKTTILEALLKNGGFSIGKKVDDIDWLISLFEPQSQKYTNPHPQYSVEWFKKHITGVTENNEIWFSDDLNNIISKIKESQRKDNRLSSFNDNLFEFNGILVEFFRKSKEFFTPILIPPKRQLEFSSAIDLNQEITPSGNGIINKLFFLKNQDLMSSDYKVYKNIYEIFQKITGTTFNIVPNKSNQISLYYNTNGKWIPAYDNGLGLSDVLIIISVLNILENNVFFLEEPENHLHAEYQKRLLKYIESIKSKQFS